MIKLTIEPVDAGGMTYFVVVDERGYPRAQGSRALCERVLKELGAEAGRPAEAAGDLFLRADSPK